MTAPTVTAPQCPDWCDGICRTCSCAGPDCPRLHTQLDMVVTGTNGDGKPNAALVALERQDTADGPGRIYLHLDLEEHSLHLTPAAARDLAAVLNLLADLGEPR
jgi:hypothetical protein